MAKNGATKSLNVLIGQEDDPVLALDYVTMNGKK